MPPKASILRSRRGSSGFAAWRVRVLFGPDVLPLHRPRQGKRDRFPWHLTLPALKEAAAHQTREPPGQLQ
jgi:hypothetical protein